MLNRELSSHLIERYKTCKDAKDVTAMQETIQAEMEEEGKRNRQNRGMSTLYDSRERHLLSPQK